MPSSPRTILVTGGSGFLGRHLLARLHTAGYHDVLAPTRQECDLTREWEIRNLLEVARPNVVIHLAARVGGIGANRRQPGTFAYQNLIMGALLIEQCRLAGVGKIVLAGTTCAYPRDTPAPFCESALWDGYPEPTNAPYALAKKMLLVQLQAYRQEFGLRSACLLFANLYGPGDHFDLETSHVIPALMRKCVTAKQRDEPVVTVWGSGKPTREFLYVADAAHALELAVGRLDEPEPVNIGTGVETSIANLARLIARLVGYKGELCFDPTRPDGQPRRCLDVSRARERLGFTARMPLEEGLRRTVAWYLEHAINSEENSTALSRRVPAAKVSGSFSAGLIRP
jgi:GDP-L-fucose synthase